MNDKKPAPHGWIILDKPRGLGSTQAVSAVKRNLREAGYTKTKVGHGGTLDPLAEGVLLPPREIPAEDLVGADAAVAPAVLRANARKARLDNRDSD